MLFFLLHVRARTDSFAMIVADRFLPVTIVRGSTGSTSNFLQQIMLQQAGPRIILTLVQALGLLQIPGDSATSRQMVAQNDRIDESLAKSSHQTR
jgi:hypothetical protein